jgi:hypothetical protein
MITISVPASCNPRMPSGSQAGPGCRGSQHPHVRGCTCACCFPATCRDHWIAYKALLAPGPGTQSQSLNDTVKVKGLASGSFTFHQETQIPCASSQCISPGMTVTPIRAATFTECLSACITAGECAAVSMTGVSAPDAGVSYCGLIQGDSSAGNFRRSFTKTVTSHLTTGELRHMLWCAAQPLVWHTSYLNTTLMAVWDCLQAAPLPCRVLQVVNMPTF